MKHKIKNIALFLLVGALLCSLPVVSAFASDTETGITFTHMGSYAMEKSIEALPRTIEAELLLSTDQKGAAGVLLSNRDADGKDDYIELAMEKNGNPTLKYTDSNGIAFAYRFKGINLCTGKKVHLAVVIDASLGEVRCYVDGILQGTMKEDNSEKPFSDCSSNAAKKAFFVGGDATKNNPNYFLGTLYSLCAYDSVRSERDIREDMNEGAFAGSTSLLFAYNMKGAAVGADVSDLSSNANDLACTLEWVGADQGAYTKDFDFSIAVVGDTQTITFNAARGNAAYQKSLTGLYTWIIDHKDEKKIQYVVGLGDITEKGEDWGHKNNDTEAETAVGDKEWQTAREAISQMDGKIPYTLTRGSGHDGLERFNEWFGAHEGYTQCIAGYFKEGRIENVYHIFEVGDVKYMIFSLDFGAKDDVLSWANEVARAHPDHRVIVSTHAYLNTDGSTLDHGEDYAPSQSYYDASNNDGNAIWERFVSKHENIFLVLSGHMTSDDIVMKQRVGEKGNTVTEMLIDPQGIDRNYTGGTAMVAMLYFSGDDVFVEYYSTAQDMYKPLRSFEINHKHAYVQTVVPPVCGQKGYTKNECICGESYRTDSTAALRHTYDSDTDADCNLCGKLRRVEVEEESLEESESVSAVESTGQESEGNAETVGETFTGGRGISVLFIVCIAGAAVAVLVAFWMVAVVIKRSKRTK